MPVAQPTLTLNNGVAIPQLGFGVYQSPPGKATQEAVLTALEVGYRHIDTAAFYRNEKDVGAAVLASGLPRAEVFVTTKLWNTDQGYDATLRAFDKSSAALGLESIDLYLIHWPVPDKRLESWRALTRLYEEGRCRAVGVSNYTVRHLNELFEDSNLVPAVNQVEFSPFLYQKDLLEFCSEKQIVLEAYSPLTKGERLTDKTVAEIAKKRGKTPAQILIRWGLEHGVVSLPKSNQAARIRENAEVFDFKLSEEEVARLDALNEDFHTSWDPTDEP